MENKFNIYYIGCRSNCFYSSYLIFKNKHYIGIFLFAVYPIIAFFLLSGNETLGLEHVGTHKWGGGFLTLLLGGIGIVFALPLGIVLALGRRSKLPVVSVLSVMFIEFWRGIPLITVLFFAAVMFPLFVPQGIEIDNLLRCIVGLNLIRWCVYGRSCKRRASSTAKRSI